MQKAHLATVPFHQASRFRECHGCACNCVIPETQFVTPSSLLWSLPFTWGQWLKHQASPSNYLFVSVVLVPGLSNKTIFNPTETPREKILLRLQFLLPHEQTNDDVRTRMCHLTPNASHASVLFLTPSTISLVGRPTPHSQTHLTTAGLTC